MNDKWMKNLKNLTEGYQKKAPEGLLDDIKREMSRRGIVPASETEKAPVVPMKWWRRAAAVVALAFASGVAIYVLQNEEAMIRQEMAEADVVIEKPVAPIQENLTPYTDVEIASSVPVTTHKKATQRNATQPIIPVLDEVHENSTDVDKKNRTDEVDVVAQEDKEGEESSQTGKTNYAATHEREYLAMNSRPTRRSKQKQRRWSVGPYYGGGATMQQHFGSGDTEVYLDYPGGNTNNLENWAMVGPRSNFYTAAYMDKNNVSVVEIEEKHHRPIKAGVSLRIVLDERWSLLTGINYSYLYSEFIEANSSYKTSDQKLHYLGIPVSASYNLWSNNHAGIYVTAGGEIEKLIKGKQFIDQGANREPLVETVKENRPVLSTLASAGIEYLATEWVSLYAEPGISYHFDNGSGVLSSYTDKPFDFNISIGLRINLNR
ncbi:MAG: outer membrane beta-barrel protein [Bacteroidales bacterium]|nr:outer membrane beta-barrel protein [Bacteroidales bacterium]